MKKYFYLLLAIPFLGLLAACHDDDSVPQVSVKVDYEGAVDVDGVLYVVQGEPFSITSVTVVPDQGTGNAVVGPISYALDYSYIGTAEAAPYGVTFDTENMNLGRHLLQLSGTIAQQDKSLASLNLSIRIMIVGSAEDIPVDNEDAASGGTFVKTANLAD